MASATRTANTNSKDHLSKSGRCGSCKLVDADSTSVGTEARDGELSNYSEYSISAGESNRGRDSVACGRRRSLRISPGDIRDFYTIDESELDDLTYRSVCSAFPVGQLLVPSRCVKAISKNQVLYPEHLYSEVAITQLLDHQGVMDRYECFEDKTFIYLVTEMCEGGNLFERVSGQGPLNEAEATVVMQQIFEAVAYIHGQGVVHRDLTCEHIFLQSRGPLEEAVVKVTGFDRARSSRQTDVKVRAGSSPYAAPEALDDACDCASDYWSCGCIMFVLLCGYHPFVGRNDKSTMSKIKRGSFSFKESIWDVVSEEAKDLIQMLLRPRPEERLTARQALSHPWMRGMVGTSSI